MRISTFISVILGSLLIGLAGSAVAQSQIGYVSDSYFVPLRRGKGTEYKIIRGAVKTGTKLEIVAEDGEWSEVILSGGTQGWMRSQYIVKQPIARMQLDSARAELQKARESQQVLQERNDALTAENQKLKAQMTEQGATLEDTSTELDEIRRIAASSVDLNKRHEELLNSHQLLQTRIDVLKAENSRYQNDNRQKWFFYGAASVLLGVIITLVVPLFKRQKRHSEWLN